MNMLTHKEQREQKAGGVQVIRRRSTSSSFKDDNKKQCPVIDTTFPLLPDFRIFDKDDSGKYPPV